MTLSLGSKSVQGETRPEFDMVLRSCHDFIYEKMLLDRELNRRSITCDHNLNMC